MNITKLLFNLIFPSKCIGCGSPGHELCTKCEIRLKRFDFPVCIICENLSINGFTHKICLRTNINSIPNSFNASYIYNKLIKKIILESKSKSKSYTYLNLLIDKSQARQHLIDIPIDAVTFVPFSRRKNRLINHSEYIAKRVAQSINKKCHSIVLHTGHKKEQKKLNKFARIENSLMKYKILASSKNLIQGKSLLLIDDVCTTGSTLLACSRLLLQNGASKVHCYVLAKDLKNF